MKDIALDCNFLSNKEAFEKEEKKPYVIALAGLMIVTGVHRLFEKGDVYQLLKRAQLFFPEQNIIDNFFTNEVLFCFQYKYVQYQFKYKHLKELIGLETLNAAKNKVAYNDWVSGSEACHIMYNIFALDGVLSGLILEDMRDRLVINEEDKVYGKVLKQRKLCLSTENSYKAVFLAETITKELSTFKRLKDDFPNKFKVLELRTRVFHEPEFNIEEFPLTKQKELDIHFNDKVKKEDALKLIYLAWLWANDFVIKCDDGFLYVDPRVKKFNLEEYKILGIPTSLPELFEEYKLDTLFPLLKDPETQKLAHRPWDKIDVYSK